MSTIRITVIGIDDSPTPHFTAEVQSVIARAKIFSGGARHHKILSQMAPRILPSQYEWIDITPPMEALIKRYQEHGPKHDHDHEQGPSEIVVFASGDPLFYGFAQTLQRLLPQAQLTTYPHFSSLQQLAHKIAMPYQDLHAVSLTGRSWHKFDEALIRGHEVIGILTDRRDHTPPTIARRMLDYGYDNYTMVVGELLGNTSAERITRATPQEVAERTPDHFAHPNNIILRRTEVRPKPFGIADNLFTLLDGREKMITKMPIRLVTLSQLELHDARTLWDIGFCTGSISIEAKMQFPHLHIEAFEVREGCDKIIEANMQRFGTPGINYTIGNFTTIDLEKELNSRPCQATAITPDAIFIGGHGGEMEAIVTKAVTHLTPHGAIVFNSVSQQSHDLFTAAAAKHGLQIENSITVQVDLHNTITVIKATRR